MNMVTTPPPWNICTKAEKLGLKGIAKIDQKFFTENHGVLLNFPYTTKPKSRGVGCEAEENSGKLRKTHGSPRFSCTTDSRKEYVRPKNDCLSGTVPTSCAPRGVSSKAIKAKYTMAC